MPVAYSNLTVIKATVRADSQANLLADLDDQLTQAGWIVKTTVTNGFKYVLESPDGFQCKVVIQYVGDWGSSPYIALATSLVVQFMSLDEASKGFPHQLVADGTYPQMQIVAGICQLFIAVPGVAGARLGSVAGGIPAQPPNEGPCVAGRLAAPAVTQIWWSCGGSNQLFVGTHGFREGPNCFAGSCYCLNGTVVIAPDNNSVDIDKGRLSLFALTPIDSLRYWTPHRVVTYQALAALSIDALLGWEWQIRGQLWDAFLQTATIGPLDEEKSFEDLDGIGNSFAVNTIAWHIDFYSTLRLVHGPPPGSGGAENVAF